PIDLRDNLDALLRAHLHGEQAPATQIQYRSRRGLSMEKGRYRLGAYTPAPGGKTKWLCIDLDGAGHADALADPDEAARRTLEAFRQRGLPAYLERSGGGKGWHVWCFFAEPIYAARARRLALLLAPEDAALQNGETAVPAANRGIEVFPKQTQHRNTGKGLGNLVWLPWWSGAPEGANTFYEIGEGGEFRPTVPSRFETASAETLLRVIPMKEEMENERRAKAGFPVSGRVSHPVSTAPPAAGVAEWKAWRQEALARLALESVYGPWLTGRYSGAGWLECRDPRSGSGDRNPSAGISDGTNEAERGTFHSFIGDCRTQSVFDFLIDTGKASDFREAQRLVAELSGVARPTAPPDAEDRPVEQPVSGEAEQLPLARPVIQVNKRQLEAICRDAVEAIVIWNQADDGSGIPPPYLFSRSGQLVRIVKKSSGPAIEALNENAVYGLLARAANWVKLTNEGRVPCSPVRDAARDMLAFPSPRLPLIESISTIPLFARDGRFIAERGYDCEERLWLDLPRNLRQLAKAHPRGELDRAKRLLLEELLGDFPFVTQADRAHALAAILLPFTRRMIAGPTPLHLIEAPTPGSGKGLLANVVSVIVQGASSEARSFSPQEEEARKMLTAELARGRCVILLDNVSERYKLDSPTLAAVLTAHTWSDRILGRTEMIDLPNLALWMLTANNPNVSMEIARRCVRVRIDPSVPRPWLREGFRHENLVGWATEHRPELVGACLALVQNWIDAGKPGGGKRLGSFEDWSRVLGGILGAAGIEGFLGSLEDLYAEADDDSLMWSEFISAWWETYGPKDIPVGDLARFCVAHDLMTPIVEGVGSVGGPRAGTIRLGKALAQSRDRVFDGLRLVRSERRSHRERMAYRLAPVGPEPPEDKTVPRERESFHGPRGHVATPTLESRPADPVSKSPVASPEPQQTSFLDSVPRLPHPGDLSCGRFE
ncbi:MAG TPA: hypothetical protein PLA90_14905, partial [Candidatus Sumerlaeota bacterium]|nr:hypothetical protein [Candidatus Sumerlaeota bacterium]